MNNEAPQKLQRDRMEREAREFSDRRHRALAQQWAESWLDTQGKAPGINLGEMEQSLATMLLRWAEQCTNEVAVRCANEARLEALEQAVEAVNRAEKEFDEGGQCEPGCGCWFERIRIAIKADAAEPVPPPKPAREG